MGDSGQETGSPLVVENQFVRQAAASSAPLPSQAASQRKRPVLRPALVEEAIETPLEANPLRGAAPTVVARSQPTVAAAKPALVEAKPLAIDNQQLARAEGGAPPAQPLVPPREAKPLVIENRPPLAIAQPLVIENQHALLKTQPLPVQPVAAGAAPQLKQRVVPAVASEEASEEHLAPIVPAWAMPRPGNRSRESGIGGQKSEVGGRNSENRGQGTEDKGLGIEAVGRKANGPVLSTQYSILSTPAGHLPGPQVQRAVGMTTDQPPTAKQDSIPPSPIPNPKSQIQTLLPVSAPVQPLRIEVGQAANPRSRESGDGSPGTGNGEQKSEVAERKAIGPVLSTQYSALGAPAGHSPSRQVQQAVGLIDSHQPAPPPAAAPMAEDEFGKLPEGSPFEAIPQSGTLKLRVRRSLLLRTKVDVYRTAIVDESVCEIVQFTPRELSIIGRSLGQTHVTFWFDDPAMAPVTYLVEVQPDIEQVRKDEEKYRLLEDVVNEMFPDSKIHLVIVADKLLVKGQAKDSEEAAQIMTIIRAQAGVRGVGGPGYPGLGEGLATPVLSLAASGGNPGPGYQIINMLRVPGVQQVALKVKIAELNRSAARGFGVDVNAEISFSNSVEGTKLFLASLLNASSTGGTSLIASFDGEEIDIGIRYLQERGVIRLLSEPTLVTLSGRPATFIAGGEFAVPTIVGSVGLNAVTTDFRAFGAIISFLPTIVEKDRIRLQVSPEFSQINSDLSVGGTPGLNVRAATTTVEMREGQTLAIAGLLEDTYKATNVGDLPGLAKIFGRRDTSRSETELIILVTPELVHPLEPEEVPPLPGFDVTEPTAWEFFGHGMIEGNPTRDYRSTVWPRLRKRYGMGGPAMTSGPFGHGQ